MENSTKYIDDQIEELTVSVRDRKNFQHLPKLLRLIERVELEALRYAEPNKTQFCQGVLEGIRMIQQIVETEEEIEYATIREITSRN